MSNVEVKFTNAYDLLKHAESNGISISAPINLEEILNLLVISIEYEPELEEKDVIGEIAFNDQKPVIRINPFQNSYKVRERFTIAHEIGHYCLHSSSDRDGFTDSRKTMSRSGSYWDKFESEANNFAAKLLMPKDLLVKEGKKIIEQYKVDESKTSMPAKLFVEQVSSMFLVSSKAMEYRLKNLGVIKS